MVCIVSLTAIPNIAILEANQNGFLTFGWGLEDSVWWLEPLEMLKKIRLNVRVYNHTPDVNYIRILDVGSWQRVKTIRLCIPHTDVHDNDCDALTMANLLKCKSYSISLVHRRVTSATRFRRVLQQPDSDVGH